MNITLPKGELEARIGRFQESMQAEGIDHAILRHGPDLFYFTGTVQDAHLLIPAQGTPTLFVWRSLERSLKECGTGEVMGIRNFKDLARSVEKVLSSPPRKVWTTFDTLPYATVTFYKEALFKDAELMDCTHVIRLIRSVKSPWELEQIKTSCEIIDSTLREVPGIIYPGMDEMELVGEIEGRLRRNGHQGLLPMRSSLMGCLPMTQILTGEHGGIPAFILTPAGGPGLSPAMGMGPGYRKIAPHEPISIDIGGNFGGYLGDETRLFSMGPLKRLLMDAYKVCLEIMECLEEELKPGRRAGELFHKALAIVKSGPFLENFMGFKEKVQFIGHGLGLEIDEYPFLSMGNEMILKEGMVVAMEPKFVFSGLGLVGLEDTFVIEKDGANRLTKCPREIFIL